jgi:hypothetical protein
MWFPAEAAFTLYFLNIYHCLNTSYKYVYHFTGVEKPIAPTIISINETTIWANVSVTWKGEYEETSILYSFVIQVTHTHTHLKYYLFNII